jgi:hypothetical protein
MDFRYRPCRSLRAVAAVAVALLGYAGEGAAQFAGNLRLTNPIGRTVLELRMGTQPANPRLLFTAAITAGPTGGTTSLLLHQMPVADLFNPAVPDAGWVTVRSSISAFSLGGGCGRNNLIDFPFINNNRPEILRITGTTQQVITLGIAGNDQYDSVDCALQADGRVLYMLTNRTRRTLEFRREQGGLLVLVRDNFGTVVTPFAGGMRPSLIRVRRPFGALAPAVPDAHASKGGLGPLRDEFIGFFVATLLPDQQIVKLMSILDNDSLTDLGSCNGATATAPTAFTIPRESAAADGVFIGASRNSNLLWGDYFYVAGGGCTQTLAPESFGSAGPFGLYSWAGVAANTVAANTVDGNATGGGAGIGYTSLILPNSVITIEGGQRSAQPTPFASRGGPVTACPLRGSEIDAAQLAIGVGPGNPQVQHSIITASLAETLGGSSFEDPRDTIPDCD